jgi:2-oxoglutarate ferredoxin oxidoreductase subunit gamma
MLSRRSWLNVAPYGTPEEEAAMARVEMRLSGFGGQGLILAAYVLGKAAAVFEERHATLNQSFGPEARGSACSAQLVLSDEPVSYPYIQKSDVLVAMSQPAYTLFAKDTRADGIVLIEDDLVTPDPMSKLRTFGIPATKIAEELGRRIMANMVMVGFVTAITGVASVESVRESIRSSVPSGTQDRNLAAFERGLENGQAALSGRAPEEIAT